MKCRNKEVQVTGIEFDLETNKAFITLINCICSNDEYGKTLSIDNGKIQFTISFNDIEKYFKGDYKNELQ